MGYLIYILIGWGITDILVNGSIFDRIRSYFLVRYPLLSKLLTCIRCSGFWVGILMGIILSHTSGEISSELGLFSVLGSGFLIGGSSVIINALMVYLLIGKFKNKQEVSDEK